MRVGFSVVDPLPVPIGPQSGREEGSVLTFRSLLFYFLCGCLWKKRARLLVLQEGMGTHP